METNKQIIRNLKIKVVDTNEDHIKIMYTKFTDQTDFTWGYVFDTDVEDLVSTMQSPVIEKTAFYQVAGKSDSFKTKLVMAIRNDIDNFVLLDFFRHFMKGHEEFMWTPTEFGEKFPENHTMYFILSYDHTMYDMDGNLLGKIFNDFVLAENWNLDELEWLEKEVDWFNLREVGYSVGRKREFVSGNGDTVYPYFEITSEEHAMIRNSKTFDSFKILMEKRLGDISKYINTKKPWDDDFLDGDDDF